MPGLSKAANGALKARAQALEKGDREDVALLRAELAKLDVVVRDEKKRQFWRSARPQRLEQGDQPPHWAGRPTIRLTGSGQNGG